MIEATIKKLKIHYPYITYQPNPQEKLQLTSIRNLSPLTLESLSEITEMIQATQKMQTSTAKANINDVMNSLPTNTKNENDDK